MAIFYAVVDGDPLTSHPGSKVIANGRSISVEGDDAISRDMAFIGDNAWCAACMSVGVIVGGAPVDQQQRMIDFTQSGRRQAVGGDKVACKCARSPEIISTYGRRWMIFDDGNKSVDAFVDEGHQPENLFDEMVKLVSPSIEGVPYYIETMTGSNYSGRIGADGELPRIATEGEGNYMVYWGDEALAKQENEL